MAAKVRKTDELEQVLDREHGAPVFLVDLTGKTTHVVLPIDEARRLFDDYLRRELQEGFDEADRGQFVDWDADKIKSQGRDILNRRSQAS
jgi:hypothetical protein